MNNQASNPAQIGQSQSRSLDGAPQPIDSKVLLADSGKVLIEHNGATYRLSKTRSGKLILTK